MPKVCAQEISQGLAFRHRLGKEQLAINRPGPPDAQEIKTREFTIPPHRSIIQSHHLCACIPSLHHCLHNLNCLITHTRVMSSSAYVSLCLAISPPCIPPLDTLICRHVFPSAALLASRHRSLWSNHVFVTHTTTPMPFITLLPASLAFAYNYSCMPCTLDHLPLLSSFVVLFPLSFRGVYCSRHLLLCNLHSVGRFVVSFLFRWAQFSRSPSPPTPFRATFGWRERFLFLIFVPARSRPSSLVLEARVLAPVYIL